MSANHSDLITKAPPAPARSPSSYTVYGTSRVRGRENHIDLNDIASVVLAFSIDESSIV